MPTYYELLNDGSIGKSTPNKKIAALFGLNLETDQPIVYACDNKKYIKGTEPIPPEPSYAEKRKKEYPDIGEQLDMIYHDMDAWRACIRQIKEKYPKP